MGFLNTIRPAIEGIVIKKISLISPVNCSVSSSNFPSAAFSVNAGKIAMEPETAKSARGNCTSLSA